MVGLVSIREYQYPNHLAIKPFSHVSVLLPISYHCPFPNYLLNLPYMDYFNDPKEKEFAGLGEIFKIPRPVQKKAPAYQWQDFALKVIADLGIPNFKRGSVFKVCKDYDRIVIERCMNETKELAQGGERWKYFFKLVSLLPKPKPPTEITVLSGAEGEEPKE